MRRRPCLRHSAGAATFAGKFPAQPGLRQAEFAPDDVDGFRHCDGRFLRRHPTEEFHLDQLRLQRVRFLQLMQRVIDLQESWSG